MRLERYREKRDFRTTPEPRGRIARRTGTGLRYVIQKHAASHLHYDFRLEHDGVLLSWAVPKGPSFDPDDKRLAMHVEDHPLEYGDFEGIIPPRQYGSGTVMVWDRGTWQPIGDPAEGYRKGHLKFTLDGEKLKGSWALIRIRGGRYGGKENDKAWLLIKENDGYARAGRAARIIDEEPDSVISGRSLDEIARDKAHEWHSNRSVKANLAAGAIAKPSKKSMKEGRTASAKTSVPRASGRAGVAPASVVGARKARLPATLSPELATLVRAAPTGDDWLHEVKLDGYRMVCRIDARKARLFSRNGKDWTAAVPAIAKALQRVRAKQAWLDGEIAVADAQGRTRFQALQNALSDPAAGAITYFVFDLLYLDGHDLRGVALRERKRLLRAILPDSDPRVRYSVDIEGAGAEFFRQACALDLEGIVSKRADSTYRDGLRTREWVKVKCGRRQEMVIGGFTDPQGAREGFGALLLGVYDDGRLRYAGKVGTGFDTRLLTQLRARLGKLERKTPAFVDPPRGYEARGAHWVKPELVAEIAFTEWSDDGALRHPSFQGLREDKKATDVVREKPAPKPVGAKPDVADAEALAGDPQRKRATAKRSATRGAARAAASAPAVKRAASGAAMASGHAASDNVAGVKLSHPDKPYFPEAGISKRDLAIFYDAIADRMVPYLRDRPLALVRCPDGWRGQCFYQKHADRSVNAAVPRIAVPESGGTATYFGANSAQALAGLVQWGVIELHPWGSRAPRLDRPDRLIFDFDPDEGVGWTPLVEAVSTLRVLLDDLGLEGFLKTTGGKGLHVVVPIRATLEWDEAKGFARAVADFLVRTFPDRFTATVSKARRKGRIFIDYLRNAEGATAIAPYAVRARANAPVSTPIDWSELDSDVRFDRFNVRTVTERLAARRDDPWAAFAKTRQSVTRAAFRRIGFAG